MSVKDRAAYRRMKKDPAYIGEMQSNSSLLWFDDIEENRKRVIRKQRDREVEESLKGQWYTSVEAFMKDVLKD